MNNLLFSQFRRHLHNVHNNIFGLYGMHSTCSYVQAVISKFYVVTPVLCLCHSCVCKYMATIIVMQLALCNVFMQGIGQRLVIHRLRLHNYK